MLTDSIRTSTFTVSQVEGGVPIKNWAVNVERGAMEQAENLSRLPFAISHVGLMPDAHQGYGMPVGGVFFADNAVVPYAVGVDIGCGVSLIQTDLTMDRVTDVKLSEFLRQVARDVPVGNGPQAEHKLQARPWDTLYHPLGGALFRAAPDHMIPILKRADVQLGTLGGGNHFLELQRDEDGRVYFMIHSGSRSVGKKVCDRWHEIALGLNRKWRSALPHPELAWLPWHTDVAQGYWEDMTTALVWAEENRRRMAAQVVNAFDRVFDALAEPTLDVHHNYAAWENHKGRNGIVHRKGAVRAREGERVLIPGSMGTASYAATGLGNRESFETCQHGAGRARSRGDTRRATNLAEMDATLAKAGVMLITPKRGDVIDESPMAYKSIEQVMQASFDLVTATKRLLPVGVVKG